MGRVWSSSVGNKGRGVIESLSHKVGLQEYHAVFRERKT